MALPFIVLDLDGTICDNTHRRHLVPDDATNTKNWVAFNCACEGDLPITNTIDVLRLLERSGAYSGVHVVTGRGELARTPTEAWLKKYGINYLSLTMRSMGDHRNAAAFKQDVFSNMGMTSLDVVFEDDCSIIDMVRETFNAVVIVSPQQCSANK